MLEKLIWKNVFLSKEIKRNIVSFYENTAINFQSTSLLKSSPNIPSKYNIKVRLVTYICKKIQNQWLIQNQRQNAIIQLPHLWQYINYKEVPMLFSLLLATGEKVEKFKKLIDWGLNIHKVYVINGNEYNLAQQVVWAHHQSLLNLEETIEILDILFQQGVTLLDKNYLISHYEKAIMIEKKEIENNINCDIIGKKKKIDTMFSWISKSLYTYLMHSKLNQESKTVLEYIKLKKEVQEVFIERFSGNLRSSGDELINKKLFYIEEIIKRQHIFNSQSSIYNSLVLLFNLPEFTEKISNYAVSQCYSVFNVLNSKAKRLLLGSLINKNKDVILMNLMYQEIDMKWSIKTDNGENILGLALLSNIDLTEQILSHDKFDLLRSNHKGNNILHVLENFPLNEDIIKTLLKKKINKLTQVEKNFLFYQINENNHTPLIKAIKERNISMVNFLLELGVSGIEEIKGMSKTYISALDFLKQELNINQDNNIINNVESVIEEQESWLYSLYKALTIEKNYTNMTKKLNGFKKKEKVVKI